MNKHPQKATLWRPDPSWDGSASFTRVGVFDVRWEDEQILSLNNGERLVLSRSTVFFPEMVFKVGDMIAEGEFTESTPVAEATEIKDKMRTPNLSGTRYEYKAVV